MMTMSVQLKWLSCQLRWSVPPVYRLRHRWRGQFPPGPLRSSSLPMRL